MTHSNDNTLTGNGKHLSIKDRDQIEILNKEGYSNRRIANLLGFAPQTIHNEVKRGMVRQLKRQKQNGKIYDYYVEVYNAEFGQVNYEKTFSMWS